VERQIQELLELGYIRTSNSPYRALILVVKKKECSIRMCVYYRSLNKFTIKDEYPLPKIDDLLDSMKGETIFSKMDLRSGYHQIRIHPKDIEKNSLTTRDGHYEFLVIPFGLMNSLAKFMRFMNTILRPFLGKFIEVFLDDIMIFSKTKEEHVENLQKFLKTLRQEKLYAKLSTCDFCEK